MRIMTNPAQLLIAGNPGKRKRRHAKRLTTNHSQGSAMATRRKRRKARTSPARVAKRRAKRVARRSRRKGKMPAGLAAYWKAQGRGKVVRKARRSNKRGARSSKRRSRRRAKVRAVRRSRRSVRRTRTVTMPKGSTVIVKRRGRKGRKARRVARVKVNAGAVSLTGIVSQFHHNLSATMKGGAKAWLAAAAGAGVSVIGGTFMSRLTGNILGRFAPSLLTNEVAARGVGALNYLIPAALAAKFTPGLSGKTRRAIQAGGMAAALIEVVRPGLVRQTLASIPGVGAAFGPSLSGLADGMGDYLAFGLQGLGYDDSKSSNAGVLLDDDNGADGMADYATTDGDMLGDYVADGR